MRTDRFFFILIFSVFISKLSRGFLELGIFLPENSRKKAQTSFLFLFVHRFDRDQQQSPARAASTTAKRCHPNQRGFLGEGGQRRRRLRFHSSRRPPDRRRRHQTAAARHHVHPTQQSRRKVLDTFSFGFVIIFVFPLFWSVFLLLGRRRSCRRTVTGRRLGSPSVFAWTFAKWRSKRFENTGSITLATAAGRLSFLVF